MKSDGIGAAGKRRGKRGWRLLVALCLGLLLLASCAAPDAGREETAGNGAGNAGETNDAETTPETKQETAEIENTGEGDGEGREEGSERMLKVEIGGYSFTATLEETRAAQAFAAWMAEGPVTVKMSDYSGFEKVGPLGKSLPADDVQTTTSAGDIVLYNGNQIVMFYGKNSWSYTRLGRIDDLTDWETALGSGDITAVFSLVGK